MALELFSVTKTVEVDAKTGAGKKPVTFLAGVYNREGLEKSLGQPLSKGQMRKLRHDKLLMLESGKVELGYHEVPLSADVKGWQQTAFRDGVTWERDRLWNLLHYFRDLTIAQCSKEGLKNDPTQALAEFSEMILDVESAPYRYFQTGPKRGAPIPESKTAHEARVAQAAKTTADCKECVAAPPATPTEVKDGAIVLSTPVGEALPVSKNCQSCTRGLTTALINGFKTHFCTNNACPRFVGQKTLKESIGVAVKTGGPLCPACNKSTRTSWNGVTCWCAEPGCSRHGVVMTSAEVNVMGPQPKVMPNCVGCDKPLKLTPNAKFYVCATQACTKFDKLIPVDPKLID